jgi:hypothetical protein
MFLILACTLFLRHLSMLLNKLKNSICNALRQLVSGLHRMNYLTRMSPRTYITFLENLSYN